MLDIRQFRANIVRPTLEAIGAHSRAAEDLVLGTALQESNLRYLRQPNDGPAITAEIPRGNRISRHPKGA